MDFVYDLVESIHIFIPIVAVISLIVIVYFCGIGSGPQPDDNYIKNLENLAQKAGRPPQKALRPVSSPKPKPQWTPKSEDGGSPTKSPPGLKQRKPAKVEKVESPKKAAVKEEKQAEDGEWTTVTPKRKRDKQTTPEPKEAPKPVLPHKVSPHSPSDERDE